MLALLAALALQSPEAARAESLFEAGALRDARAAAERLVARSPQDPAAHVLLGRVWLAWPIVGRYQALAEFRAAARLAPRDPEPLYDVMRVGFYLGSDEGEIIARDAILGILALTPDYRDVWAKFQELYRNEAIWRKAARALARHPHDGLALERRAAIAIALQQPADADSLAALALAARGPNTPLFLVRAEAAFLAGRDAAGQALHDSAIAYADRDSTAALWARAALVAAPEEAARYDSTPPGQRRAFFQAFWGARDPNLLTPVNERLGEQTRRLADARRQFRLLHPQRMWYRSATYRSLAWLDYQSFQDTAAALAYRAGLDARGLMFVRHGKPDVRASCIPDPRVPSADPGCSSSFDGEGWLYYTPAGARSISFKDAEYFAPVSGEQLRGIRELLRGDRSLLPAPLEMHATAAFFRGTAPGYADAYYNTGGDQAALVLWAADGVEAGRTAGRGLLHAAVPAGRYRFGLDVDSAGILGRVRGEVQVPWFDSGDLKLSTLLLAADAGAHERDDVLRAVPVGLGFAAGAPLVTYAEVYGLVADDRGRVRYRARYTFAPERSLVARLFRGAAPVSFEFERESDGGATVAERLLLDPGRVPPGRYRVTLAVTDLARDVKSETVAIVVTIH